MANITKDNKGRNLKPRETQMPDGRYRYRYVDSNGKTQTIYSWKLVPTDKIPKGKRDDVSLREKVIKLERDIHDGIDTSKKSITTYQLVKKYISTKVKIANATKENYIHMLEKNIKDSNIGNMQIKDVKKSDILALYAYLYKNQGFSVNTLQLYQNLLFPSFQLAVEDSLIRLNPCNGCMKDYPQGSMSSTKEALTVKQQNSLLNFVKNNAIFYRYYAMIALMLGTGLRASEMAGLTWDNIDFENHTLTVDHQIIYKKKDGICQFYASPSKTKKVRIIPLQTSVYAIMLQHKKDTYEESMLCDFEVDGYSGFVFLNNAGRTQKATIIDRSFKEIVEAHNWEERKNAEKEDRNPVLLPHFSAHVLRHTFCTRMAEAGIDIKVLQEIMGHANISVTMQVYNHVDANRTKNEVNRIGDILAV